MVVLALASLRLWSFLTGLCRKEGSGQPEPGPALDPWSESQEG